MPIPNEEEIFFLFDIIGRILAIIAGFYFFTVDSSSNYIIIAIMIVIISTSVASFPVINLALWPIIMFIIMVNVIANPQTTMDFFMGDGPNNFFGIGVGWIYIAFGLITCFAVPRILRYNDRSENIVLAAVAASLIYNFFKKP